MMKKCILLLLIVCISLTSAGHLRSLGRHKNKEVQVQASSSTSNCAKPAAEEQPQVQTAAPVEEAPVQEAPAQVAPKECPAPAQEQQAAPTQTYDSGMWDASKDKQYDDWTGKVWWTPEVQVQASTPTVDCAKPAAEEQPQVQTAAPVEEAPVQEAPAQAAPCECAPAEAAPVSEAPVEEAPVEAPAQEAPAAPCAAPVEEQPQVQVSTPSSECACPEKTHVEEQPVQTQSSTPTCPKAQTQSSSTHTDSGNNKPCKPAQQGGTSTQEQGTSTQEQGTTGQSAYEAAIVQQIDQISQAVAEQTSAIQQAINEQIAAIEAQLAAASNTTNTNGN